MKKLSVLLALTLLFQFTLNAQQELLQSGPMLGYSTMKEAAIWLQTKTGADVVVKYWNIDTPSAAHYTGKVHTSKEKAFTALLVADTLEPGNIYQYQVYINGKLLHFDYQTRFQSQKLWKWRGDPPDFSFVTGSGTYINEKKYDRPGRPYGGGYDIYLSMLEKHPDFMLWLGDNIYLREPDWNSWTGIIHRYTHDRATPQLQPFMASVHNYAIWDDHDFGPNDSDKSFWNKNLTLKAFKLFWANPSYGTGDIKGTTTSFQWGDADFFLLDNRWYRDANRRNYKHGYKTELGEKQLQWLFDNLASSYATFKFVVMGGQFLSNTGMFEAYTNYGFDKERQRIIDFIYSQNIKNVIFITGDVHFSELSVLKQEGKPVIWDITSSPLNSGPNTNGINQKNTLRVPGSVIMQRNFAEIKISGPAKKRVLHLTYFDTNGNKLWEYDIIPEKNKRKKH
jgi:alkaline phosphatase D